MTEEKISKDVTQHQRGFDGALQGINAGFDEVL